MFDCGICYERYTESGDHVPLVMSCGHTLCKECISCLKSNLCPTCKHPIFTSSEETLTLPRNIWLIQCLSQCQPDKTNKKPETISVTKTQRTPKTSKAEVVGQRVLFRRLDRAVTSSSNQTIESSRSQLERKRELDYLKNLARICKTKKSQDPNFNQTRFVKDGLFMKFGETRAKEILSKVYDRLKERQTQRRNATVA